VSPIRATAVRRAAARLGMELSSSGGPVRETWDWVRVRYERDGESYDCLARRTGPVTAQVATVAPPGRTQHVALRSAEQGYFRLPLSGRSGPT